MTRPLLIWTAFFSLTACLPTNPEKHERFMAYSDCNVYKNEIKSETIDHGRVEFIDTSCENKCAKEQLKNTFLLYYDSICVAVVNNHPKDNYKLIEQFIRQYHTDTTDLSGFAKWDSIARLTVALKCFKPSDSYSNGKYFDRTVIHLSLRDNKWIATKQDTLENIYPWQDKK